MKVKIMIEFDVHPADGVDEGFNEDVAKSAASIAAWDYLSFCAATGTNVGADVCEVHVDGHGRFKVAIGTDHE